MAEPMALAALALDAAIGWPEPLYRRVGHPVGGFARIIARCEARWNTPDRCEAARRRAGMATLAMLVAAAGGTAFAIEIALRAALGHAAWLAIAVAAFPALAQRSLFVHVRAVATALDTGDAAASRSAVAMIVGRDTASLDEAGVARAAIESLAESFCDGIVAPLFWLLVLGLPGAWVFKAVNTADSLVGHREPRWRAFGWAAARTDDLLAFLPARIAGGFLCAAGGGGWGTMARDARRHASPNAGWPEAAMAGTLGLRLAGPAAYDGVVYDKPWIGGGRAGATPDDLRHALSIYVRACLLLAALVAGLAWAR